MAGRISSHLRANVVGYVAVFIALSAGAYAAGLPKSSVKSKQIKDGQVRLKDLAGNSVDGSKVVDDSLTGADIRESTLQGIGGAAVGATGPQGVAGPAGATGPAGPQGPATGPAGGDLTGNYPDPTIAPNAVGGAEIAPGAITTGELAFDPATQTELDRFRITTLHEKQLVSDCDNSFRVECAAITFSVPDGRTALVSIWSSFSAFGAASETTVIFCPSVREVSASAPDPECRSPFGIENAVTVPASKYASGAMSGETLPLGPGTYVASTAMRAQGGATVGDVAANAITKILVRDSVTAAP